MKTPLSDSLLDEMDRRGLTVDRLAAMTGIHRTTISRWKNHRQISAANLELIATALGMQAIAARAAPRKKNPAGTVAPAGRREKETPGSLPSKR